MFNQIGPLEIGIVLLIVLLIFGPKRLPGLGKSLGTGMREFKDSITGKDDDRDSDEAPADQATLTAASAAPAEPPAATPPSREGEPAGTPVEPRT
ncbi:Sec-independent protein translocase subunit TatA/TatB [Capillimicrobium parvum]|uniref:Sec-independent protein translocase protein TatA n=1 Tax=Capillimicrobium parvum TaxID=2884022 RepID=A0A9E6Y312_9ACTN|nr:twin-arginine translocase TatA/TatE family subunit [Capillimicrobium parvum]UGS39294.1 Sec-independent protein translocase protein TatA [Capillimicrobium parvum]